MPNDSPVSDPDSGAQFHTFIDTGRAISAGSVDYYIIIAPVREDDIRNLELSDDQRSQLMALQRGDGAIVQGQTVTVFEVSDLLPPGTADLVHWRPPRAPH
jgi:hypothetical protein